MKILQVVAEIHAESSGPSYSVPALTRGLIRAGGKAEIHTLAPLPASLGGIPATGYPKSIFPFRLLGCSRAMLAGLRAACKDADVIHDHGIWLAPNIYADTARRGTNCKLIVSPRGMLAAWSLNHSKWKKRLVWHFFGQKRALFAADMFHATCYEEYREIRALGLRAPVMLLPNGIDLPEALPEKSAAGRRKLVFLSRIHPKKGLEMLLEAWKVLSAEFPEWDLEIAGPLAGEYPRLLQEKVRAMRLERVRFTGELRGRDKVEFLAGAELFVLPTFNENFGLAVAEALSCGTPAVVCKGAPWEGLDRNDCGSWVETGVAGVLEGLRRNMSLDRETLRDMGRNGREWMRRDFNWDVIGVKTLECYRYLCGQSADKPDCVITD